METIICVRRLKRHGSGDCAFGPCARCGHEVQFKTTWPEPNEKICFECFRDAMLGEGNCAEIVTGREQ